MNNFPEGKQQNDARARVFLRRAPGGDDDGVIEHLSDELARDLDGLRASFETPLCGPQDEGRGAIDKGAFGELPERLKAGLEAEALDAIGMIVAEPVRLLLSCIVAHDGSVTEALTRAICGRFEVIGLAKMAGKSGRVRPA